MRIAFDLDHVLSPGADVALRAEAVRTVESAKDALNRLSTRYRKGRPPARVAYTKTAAVFDLPHVFGPGHSDVENAQALRLLLDALTTINVQYLHAFPDTPRLRDTNVVYGRTTVWYPLPGIYRLGYGDCKSFGAADAAEYAVRGVACRSVFRWNPREPWRTDSVRDFHILNDVPALPQRFEDPSKRHGMGTARALTHTAPDELRHYP